MDLDSVSVHKHVKKKTEELGQHTAILASRLVNKPYRKNKIMHCVESFEIFFQPILSGNDISLAASLFDVS